jgi:alpha-ketoglutarate-dependent taurine dioxygenase
MAATASVTAELPGTANPHRPALPGNSVPGRCPPSPFDLSDETTYACWRAAKLQSQPESIDELIVDVADPRALSPGELRNLQSRCARTNMAIYRSPITDADPSIPRRLGQQLGLTRLDANWLADEDGISQVTVKPAAPDGEAYIPYTNHAIGWHTDGYYHPAHRTIHGMILHCVMPATQGGETQLVDHELAYIAVRDANPAWMRALMAQEAMTIPARMDGATAVRAAQAGPVFSVDAQTGALHMRYTARTRSIAWHDDAATREAASFLGHWLERQTPQHFRLKLAAGMGVVGHNVLHTRSGFVDAPAQRRLLYRARFLDRMALPPLVAAL